MLTRLLQHALSGRGAHALTENVLDGLDWRLTGEKPAGAPHTIFQLVNHMIYWQDYCLADLRGDTRSMPAHAIESWPGAEAPTSEAEWQEAVARFLDRLQAYRAAVEQEPEARFRKDHDITRAECVAAIASHTSYHLGQIALLRRMLGAWPPPGGGDTW